MSGKHSRNKGANFERIIANDFKAVGLTARRGLGQARAANEVPDVDVEGLWVECKRGKRTNPRAALEQAIEASTESGRMPIAICKDDRGTPFVCMRFGDWLGRHVELVEWRATPGVVREELLKIRGGAT